MSFADAGSCAPRLSRVRALPGLQRPLLALALVSALLWLTIASAFAGELDKAGIAARLPSHLSVGERDASLPIWPLFKKGRAGKDELAGYAFEAIDLAPLPGYAGTPPNLLIAIDTEGTFVGASIVYHHEPIFHKGVREEQLHEFVAQYRGLSLKQNIRLGDRNGVGTGQSGGSVTINGVARATVSVRVMNESILASALKVARARLGHSGKVAVSVLVPDDGTTVSRADLTAKAYLSKTILSAGDVDAAFGSKGSAPEAGPTEVWIANVGIPQIGRAVLGEKSFAKLKESLTDGQQAILVAMRGPLAFHGSPNASTPLPEQLSLMQDGLSVSINDTVFLPLPDDPAFPKDAAWTVLRTIKQAGLDSARPIDVSVKVTREGGSGLLSKATTKELPITYPPPSAFFVAADPVTASGGDWRGLWRDQAQQIGFTFVLLCVLTYMLARRRRFTADAAKLNRFRLAFLALTLFGLGWWAQGQISIMNVVGLINAARVTGDLHYLLFDPVSLLVWVFVIGSLEIFGRGTFCGWLCPFGALQEFAALAAARLGIRQITVPYAIDRWLRLIKYVVLAAILGAAVYSTPLADTLGEIEPFKTAITLGFNRAWPYAGYAVAMVLLSALVFRGFCLYICPLGAALAIAGRVRQGDWIPRRAECGTPCQLCKVKCRYGAIEPKGEIRYDECFQCLDCVAIYDDPKTCVPEVLASKGKSIPSARITTLIPRRAPSPQRERIKETAS